LFALVGKITQVPINHSRVITIESDIRALGQLAKNVQLLFLKNSKRRLYKVSNLIRLETLYNLKTTFPTIGKS
jgi:hypothetical protein